MSPSPQQEVGPPPDADNEEDDALAALGALADFAR